MLIPCVAKDNHFIKVSCTAIPWYARIPTLENSWESSGIVTHDQDVLVTFHQRAHNVHGNPVEWSGDYRKWMHKN